MAVISLPNDFALDAFDFTLLDFSYAEISDSTGDSADRLGGPPRWACQLASLEKMDLTEAGRWQSLVTRLRGGVNHLAVYDPLRIAPEGTLRGLPTVVFNVSAGATVMVITANGTVKEGDLLQVGTGVGTSQLLSITANASPSAGQMAIDFEPPLRYPMTAGTAITWNRPRFYAKQRGASATWRHVKGARASGDFRLDLVEQW